MTIRRRVLHLLKHAGAIVTAVDIYHVLNVESGIGPSESVKLSSLSSVLKRMCDGGELDRLKNFGPRGGYGYRLKVGA